MIVSNNLLEILNGELLGDGSMKEYTSGIARLVYRTTNEEYFDHLLSLLYTEGVELSYISRGEEKLGNSNVYIFWTKNYAEFYEINKKWYVPGESHRVKIIPDDIIMTPTVVRHWYVGDGRLETCKQGRILLSTYGFKRAEVDTLCDKLNKAIGVEATVHEKTAKRYPYILLPKRFTRKFIEYIGDPVPGYQYKWD